MDLKCYTILEMGDVYKWDKPCGLLKFENQCFLGHPRKGHLAGNIVQKFKFSASFWWNQGKYVKVQKPEGAQLLI